MPAADTLELVRTLTAHTGGEYSYHVIPLMCQEVASRRKPPSSSAQTYHNRFFIDPNLFATLRTILFMPKAFFATASIKGSLHTFTLYDFFFFHRNPWGHSIYSNTTLERCFPEGSWRCLLRPPPPSRHCFPAVFAPVYSCPYIISESIPQRQVAISHVGHLSF